MFLCERKQFIIVTNTSSLLSVVFPGKGINQSDKLLSIVRESVSKYLRSASADEAFLIPEKSEEPKISKIGDRALTGTMNELVFQTIHFMRAGIHDLDDITQRNNDTIFSMIDYQTPKKRFLELQRDFSVSLQKKRMPTQKLPTEPKR